jgi:cell division protein FtsL
VALFLGCGNNLPHYHFGPPLWVILGWLVIKAVLVSKGKDSKKEFYVQIILLCVTFFAAIPLAHLANYYDEQRELESIKERIEWYKKQQNVLPAKLEEADNPGRIKEFTIS